MDSGKLAGPAWPIKREDLNTFTTEDGEPFAIFVWGHVTVWHVTGGLIKQALRDMASDWGISEDELWPDPIPPVGQYWIRRAHTDEDDPADEEWPWRWCEKEDQGATAITGVKF